MREARIVVAIQARTNSSRLPGKVLLPIGGYTISVLAAKKSFGRDKHFDVCVFNIDNQRMTTWLPVLAQHSVDCFRGDLNNVLSRFVGVSRLS
ncbi:hypothetical protein OK016_10250 [Vibrio chagasii]|nr:hypothetical protein [Vibrio chagasii]